MPKQQLDRMFALIGRYVVISMIVAGVLLVRADSVPFWCAFPVTTIWMILRGDLAASEKGQ